MELSKEKMKASVGPKAAQADTLQKQSLRWAICIPHGKQKPEKGPPPPPSLLTDAIEGNHLRRGLIVNLSAGESRRPSILLSVNPEDLNAFTE
jgi:hypothetical protein